MNLFYVVVICFFAGMGAGLGTGFAGMSAAAVISPMLITFLNVEPYTAVGIALASDVLASAASAALGAISEDSSVLGKSLIFVGLAEGVCLYGLIISFMILGKL